MRLLQQIILLSLIVGLCTAQHSFKSVFGANEASPGDNLFGVMGFTRKDVDWGSIQPNKSVWLDSYLQSYGQDVLGCQKDGVQTLPILDYIPLWAIDTSERNWTQGSTLYKIVPQPNNVYFIQSFTMQNGKWVMTGNGTANPRFPPANVADWENYVTKVVQFLGSAPYNLEYFQIWNEAHICSGFYYGSMADYFQKFHIPAAKIIQAAGKKVVYGGYPVCGSITDLISWVDQNNAWQYIDITDVHYNGIGAMETFRSTSVARGFPNTGAWQTEVGFTSQLNFIADNYPRFLYYGATHNWNYPGKFKIMYYADWAPDDPKAYGYDMMLHSGSNIYVHGYNLLTLGQDLFYNTSAISAYLANYTTSPSLQIGTYGGESIEAFTCGQTVIFISHVSNPPTQANLVINAPISIKTVTKVERVDISGVREDITSSVTSSSSSISIPVTILDTKGSLADQWNSPYSLRVFYVVVTLTDSIFISLPPPPASQSHIKIV